MQLSKLTKTRVKIVDNHGPDLMVDGHPIATGLPMRQMKRLAVQIRRSLAECEARPFAYGRAMAD